jgi:hypothetical protein
MLLIVAGTIVAANAIAASSQAAHTGKIVTLHLVMKGVGGNYVDNPPRQGFDAPPLIGDQFSFASDLLTRSGKHAGTFGATCIFTRGGVKAMAVCTGMYSLKGGQIMGMAKAADTNTTQVAVVGGTGAYANVTGTSTEVSRGANSPFTDVTIRLIYP